MKTPLFSLAILLIASGSLVSCTSGNQRLTWNRIQSKGLFPAMFHPVNGTPKSVIGMTPTQRMQAYESSVVTTGMRGSPIPKLAKMVPGKVGYVKTPYTLPERAVDVRDCQPGALKKCPYTGRFFVVPPTSVGSAGAVKPTVTPVVVKPKTTTSTTTVKSTPKPKPVTSTVAPKPQTPPSKPQAPTTTEPNPAPQTTTPKETPPPSVPDKPATPEVKPTPKPETTVAPPNPLGSPVPGRPGYVYSPYGNKSQLVDVQGMKPGTLVRCPYSGKLFRVP
jgi:hypothetical protein